MIYKEIVVYGGIVLFLYPLLYEATNYTDLNIQLNVATKEEELPEFV